MRILVHMLLSAGAKEVSDTVNEERSHLMADSLQVHLRIASPPVKHPCFMGINIPTKEELLANERNLDEITAHIGASSVAYLSVEGLTKVAYCDPLL